MRLMQSVWQLAGVLYQKILSSTVFLSVVIYSVLLSSTSSTPWNKVHIAWLGLIIGENQISPLIPFPHSTLGVYKQWNQNEVGVDIFILFLYFYPPWLRLMAILCWNVGKVYWLCLCNVVLLSHRPHYVTVLYLSWGNPNLSLLASLWASSLHFLCYFIILFLMHIVAGK